ncbi:SHOCT domain-containing protein [Nocardioides sp. CER19]|uniref:SHOCT domain-containing protein n=1 Tax=Nocardioides sp. CER19 TaxID=3038538 RepID=UPI002447C583|nr:SHOCT domain-containing protein [Nocardioides sp. CER19]MDH2415234.1 SHOCT domain-containing protein [Nocardioides sp. CER19]
MILVPRQLQRAGMTGSVPYYGGRLTPAQVHALEHPNEPLPPSLRLPPVSRSATTPKDPKVVRQLRKMRDKGVITEEEFTTISARVRA